MVQIINPVSQDSGLGAALTNLGNSMFGPQTLQIGLLRQKLQQEQQAQAAKQGLAGAIRAGSQNYADMVANGILGGVSPEEIGKGRLLMSTTAPGADPLGREISLAQLGAGQSAAGTGAGLQKMEDTKVTVQNLQNQGALQRQNAEPIATTQNGQTIYTTKGQAPGLPAEATNEVRTAQDLSQPQNAAAKQTAMDLKTAGAQRTFENTLDKNDANRWEQMRGEAAAAQDNIATIDSGLQLLDAGMATGPGADLQTTFRAIASKLTGQDDPRVVNAQTFAQAMKPLALQMAAALKPTSNVDLAFSQAAAGGDANLMMQSLKEILNLQKQRAAQTVMTYQKELAKNPGMSDRPFMNPQPKFVDPFAARGQAPQQGQDPISQAKAAIAAGAPRDAVIRRLQQNGIDPAGL